MNSVVRLWREARDRRVVQVAGAYIVLDNGIASSNKVGTGRIIVPVQIIGDQDGAWDKAAWRADAFYGHPLAGFTWPPQ